MKKLLYLSLIFSLLTIWGLSSADTVKTDGRAGDINSDVDNGEINSEEEAPQIISISPYFQPKEVVEAEFEFKQEVEPLTSIEQKYLRLEEIQSDGVISEDELAEYREILSSDKAPEFPPVTDNIIYESEPNNSCDSADVIAVGDTVQCAWADGSSDSTDYYTFTLDSTYDMWTVILESHNGMNCGTGMNIFDRLWIFNSECTEELAFDDNSGWNGHGKIVTFLPPGTYVALLMPDTHWDNGWYHLSLLAQEYVVTPGQDCENPISLTIPGDLPYSDINTTCGMFNFYDTIGCIQNRFTYGWGEEIVYKINVTADGWYDVTLDPHGTQYTCFSINYDCPTTGCMIFSRLRDDDTTKTEKVWLEAGIGTYYLMIDHQFHQCIPDFELSVTAGAAPLEGELCQNPIVIPSDSVTGYTDTRDSRLYEDNYRYGGKDIVYMFTTTTNEILTFSLCNSPEDWRGYVWLYPEATTICNGDETYWQSPNCLTGGSHTELTEYCPAGTYWLIVDGSYTPPNEGLYTLEITAYVEPCSDVSEIPYNDSCQNIVPVDLYMGNTLQFSGNNCNSTQDCDSLEIYVGLPGVWEAFTTTDTGNITIDFCDTRPGWASVYTVLFDACPCTNGSMRFRAGNGLWWDHCDSANVATILWPSVPPGTYYYNVLLDTTHNAFGDYTINVTLEPPYEVSCPPGAIEEGEPSCYDFYVDNYNAGCLSDPPTFRTIQGGDTICGTTGTFEPWPSLDRDYYELDSTDDWVSIEFKAVAELPLSIALIDGTRGCDYAVTLDEIWDVAPLDTAVVAAFDLQPGKYWLKVQPWSFSGWYCPTDYVAILDTYPGNPHYCDACFTTTTGDYISQVVFNTINNYTGPEGPPCSYGDYTSVSTQVEQYGTYTLTVSVESNPNWRYVRAWIDWNQDLIFEDEESYYLGDNVDPVVSVDIMVPGNAVVGPTRMRIMEAWDDPDPDGACSNSSSGEVEDYTVDVLAGIPPIFSVNPNSIEDSVGLGEIATQVLTVSNLGTGADLAFTSDVWIDPPGPAIGDNNGDTRKGSELFNENYKRDHVKVDAPLNPSVILQGGDDIANAEPITTVPTTVSGTTWGYNDDYYEVCPLTSSGGLDVVYSYTPAQNEWLNFNLCLGNTNFDTRMYIYEDSATVGDPYACNEDACSSPVYQYYVSALNDVPMMVGHTYYIVVDGYDWATYGNYVLDVFPGIQPPQPEECPEDETSIYSQDPTDEYGFNAFTSDAEGGWRDYENYGGAWGEITGITWWGVDLYFNGSGWYECDASSETFEITFYNDDAGIPGLPVYVDTVTVIPDSTDWSPMGYQQKRYYAALSEPVYHPEGWLSIQAITVGDACWFLWQNSTDGDESCLQYDEIYDDWYLQDSDLAFCFTGSPFDWLSIDVDGGLIPAGQSTDITVTMDATELTDNTYSGNIRFHTNEPANPNPSVPVTFIVGAGYPQGCDYIVGDVNGSNSYNGLDITYGVAFFKGGPLPLCEACALCPDWHYCGDVNGSCNYNGLDITYGVAYFKGGPGPNPCDDCPPAPSISIHKDKSNPIFHRGKETVKKALTK